MSEPVKMTRDDRDVWLDDAPPGTFSVDGFFLAFVCPRGQHCGVHVGPVQGLDERRVWSWDGNRDAPTLSPSINCGQCGWHGFIRQGTMVPA